jgi:long-chain acyl-CoA synthetase
VTAPGTATLVGDLLDRASEAHGERPALVHGDERLTYAALRERVDGVAGALAARGLGPGDAIAIVLPNVPAFAIAFFAVARLGGVVVPMNTQFKEPELDFAFRDSGVRAVITDARGEAGCGTVVSALDASVQLFTADALEAMAGRGASLAAPDRRGDDDMVFQYSSGSTGRPKRVPRTHRQLCAEADGIVATEALTPDEVIFATIPLFHTYGMGCCLLAAVRSGAALVLFEDPHPFVLTREHALSIIERERVTVFPAVPFTFRLLAEAPGTAEVGSVRLWFSAANALPRATFDAFGTRFGAAVRQLYGCTEAGAVTINVDEDPWGTAASVGRPMRDVEVAVLGPEGETLEPGRIGEIAIRSPAMTRGYAGMEELNRQAFSGGFFLSGDRGRLDDEGRLFITGRTKLLIDVKGDKVDPIEVEDVLAVHPKVREVVVVGVRSGVEGEELVKAVVVPEGPCQERELVRYCRERLADYKVPQTVEFLDEIRKSPAGKVLRKYLVE